MLIDAETEKIPGAAILGIGGDEITPFILNMMYADVTCTVIQRAMHIYPTVTTGLIPTMPGELNVFE